MISTAQAVIGVGAGIAVALAALIMTRRRLISERITLFWIVNALAIVAAVVFPGFWAAVSRKLGFVVTSNALFVFAILGILIFNLYVSTKLSKIDQQLRRLAQELALRTTKPSDDG